MPQTETICDHDLLIELRTEMRGVRSDIQDLTQGVSSRLLNLESNAVSRFQFDDHEKRLREVERTADNLATIVKFGGSIAVALLGLAEVLLNIFFR